MQKTLPPLVSDERPANQVVYLIDDDGITQYVKSRTVNTFNAVVETRLEFTPDKSQAKRFSIYEAVFIRNENQATDLHYMNA